MAGRGTDIKLEAGVADIGGLYVIGNDPPPVAPYRPAAERTLRPPRGSRNNKFFISFEDSLLRLFASPRITGVLQRFRPPEGEADHCPHVE